MAGKFALKAKARQEKEALVNNVYAAMPAYIVDAGASELSVLENCRPNSSAGGKGSSSVSLSVVLSPSASPNSEETCGTAGSEGVGVWPMNLNQSGGL